MSFPSLENKIAISQVYVTSTVLLDDGITVRGYMSVGIHPENDGEQAGDVQEKSIYNHGNLLPFTLHFGIFSLEAKTTNKYFDKAIINFGGIIINILTTLHNDQITLVYSQFFSLSSIFNEVNY